MVAKLLSLWVVYESSDGSPDPDAERRKKKNCSQAGQVACDAQGCKEYK